MRKILGFILLIAVFTGFTAFSKAINGKVAPFTGLWQGVEKGETSIQIEFSPEGYYLLSVGGKKLTENIESWGKVKYDWGKRKDRYLITVFGEKEPEITTRLEAVFLESGLLQLQVFSEAGLSVSSILLKKV